MSRNGKKESAEVDMGNLPMLPDGWCWTTVDEIGEVRLGRQRSPKNRSDKYPTQYVRAANITWRGLSLDDVMDMDFKPSERTIYALQPGDILLSEASGSADEVGKPAIWNGEIAGCCFQNTVIRFRPHDLPPDYPFVVFCHFARNKVFAHVAKGIGIHHLGADRFGQMPFPFPPVAEQVRIKAKVDELFSDLDVGVAALERVRANLKRYRAAVLKTAVEGRLTADWRAKNPPKETGPQLLARILRERRRKWEEEQLAAFAKANKTPPAKWREKYEEPAAPDCTGLPALPDGWCWATIEQVSEYARYGSSAKASPEPLGVPVLRMGNIQDGALDVRDLKYLPVDHAEFPDLLLQAGDLLFNRTNSAELVGKSAVYRGEPSPCSYASYLISVRFFPGCESRCVCYFINSAHGRTWVASVVSQQVGQANVNGTKLQRLPIPLPPIDEQSTIIAEVEQRLSIVEEAEAQVVANVTRSARLRQAILKRAFEGTLVPQDPADEPAAALLERIKAGNAATNGKAKPRKTR